MAVFVPCTPNGQARWTQRTAIAGRDYQLTFDWNQRTGHWSLSLADQDGSPIASGLQLVTNWPLLRTVLDTRCPPGLLVVIDTLDRGEDPGFSDLGSRFVLAYFDPSELAA
jgi:hypothetical protein